MAEPLTVDNPEEARFEIWVDDKLAGVTTYARHDDRIEFLHTEVDDAFAGQGLAKKLATYELDEARRRGLAVYPYCPFVRGFIAKNHEYVDLVPESERRKFGLAAS